MRPRTADQADGISVPHYVVLDGLRGVAALCVVIFHFTEARCNSTPFGICHGFLAVDFFFCLSGFVLGHAYSHRMAQMGLRRFLRARFIRLHPLVLLGTVLGLLAFYADVFAGAPEGHAWDVLRAGIASSLLIPYSSVTERSEQLFTLNPPSWSLFWEYLASVVYAVALFRFRRRALMVLTAVAAIILMCAGWHAGNLSGGWGWSNFSIGGARVVFSFCAGLLVFRSGYRPRTGFGFSGLGILLVLAFLMPYAQGGWVREAGAILLYFPLLVAMGAGAVVTHRVSRTCRLLGDLSYPLYMTHYAVVSVFGRYASRQGLAGGRFWFAAACGTLCTVGLSWLALNFFDRPVRSYLQRTWRENPA